MYATLVSLVYIPDTVLSSITLSTTENRSKLIQHGENGRIFLDLPPVLCSNMRWNNYVDGKIEVMCRLIEKFDHLHGMLKMNLMKCSFHWLWPNTNKVRNIKFIQKSLCHSIIVSYSK
jgi:hypothetical protein